MFKCCRLWEIFLIHIVTEIYLGEGEKNSQKGGGGGAKSEVVRSGL